MAARSPWHRRWARSLLRAVGLDAAPAWPGFVVTRSSVDRFDRERGIAEFLQRRHVADLLHRLRIERVLDVGANVGQYASGLRREGYAGTIDSFEPVPETFERLRRKAAGDPRWRVHSCALGSADGVLKLNVTHDSVFSSLREPNALSREKFGEAGQVRRTAEVSVRRLDGLLTEEAGRPRTFLKMDTQGFDLEVFRGLGDRAGEILGLQSELSLVPIYEGMPRMPEALGAYEAAGFEIAGLFPVSWDRATCRLVEVDCVMVRPGASA
jgi:FkbM family methyltransferase